jgi:hypothetical protein
MTKDELFAIKKAYQRIAADIRNQAQRVAFSAVNLKRDITITEATDLSDEEIDKLIIGSDQYHYVYSYHPEKYWVSVTKFVSEEEHSRRLVTDYRHTEMVKVFDEMLVEYNILYNRYKDMAKVVLYGSARKPR